MYSGDVVYPNVYIAFYGPTGDKKTTAQRRIPSCNLLEHAPDIEIIQNAGSTEGLADRLMSVTSGCYLFLWEEFATFLAVARWSGSTLLQFLTEAYDCPPVFKRDFRKEKINLTNPTPTILTMSTPEWFWQHARPDDFFGGSANRFLYLTGAKKDPIPEPTPIDMERIRCIKDRIQELSERLPLPKNSQNRRARWTAEAGILWAKFYRKFEGRPTQGLLGAALKRTHSYVRKLAMTYAFLEGTFPEINAEQLHASIAVSSYSTKCVKQLLEMQTQNPESEKRREMERKILEWLQNRPGLQRLRAMQQQHCRVKGDSETFNRVMQSMIRTDQINTCRDEQGRMFVSLSSE
jgi:hypothetical protein